MLLFYTSTGTDGTLKVPSARKVSIIKKAFTLDLLKPLVLNRGSFEPLGFDAVISGVGRKLVEILI